MQGCRFVQIKRVQWSNSSPGKIKFFCSLKNFSDHRKTFLCQRKIIFPVRGKISEVDFFLDLSDCRYCVLAITEDIS